MWPPPPRKPGSLAPSAASRMRFWGLLGAAAGAATLVYASFLVDVNTARVAFVRTSTFAPQFRIVPREPPYVPGPDDWWVHA